MDSINPLNQLMQALRQQMAAQAQKTERGAKQNTNGQSATTPNPNSVKISLDQVQTRIRERIKQFDPEQRDSEQAAQIFVESILAWEFGEDALQDPRFQDISREVRKTMANDPTTWERFSGLLRSLGE
jgi:hypothetical protein